MSWLNGCFGIFHEWGKWKNQLTEDIVDFKKSKTGYFLSQERVCKKCDFKEIKCSTVNL